MKHKRERVKSKLGFTPLEINNYGRAKKLKENNRRPSKSLTGFTLIELLVVIAIIAFLASIVLVALNSARAKARDARRLADLRQINLAMQMYYDDNNTYPTFYGDSNGNPWLNLENALNPYLSKLPKDPSAPGSYYAYYPITSAWWGGNSSCNGYNVLYAYPADNIITHQECFPSAIITIIVGPTP